MALIKSVRGFTPEIGENCFLADNAAVSYTHLRAHETSV